MSADIFPMFKTKESRIPVLSQSPVLLRRSRSLRFKPNDNRPEFEHRDAAVATTTTDRGGGNGALLRRGNSFMERGERRPKHGVQSITTTKLENSPIHDGKIANRTQTKNQQSPNSRTRSLSLSISAAHLNTPKSPTTVHCSPRTPPTSPDVRNFEWDTESVASVASLTSVGSCEHASVAKNGTTFSGRSMKYVFHCNQHSGATGEDYLTPTQRVHRQVKKLKYLLHQARKDLEQKDSDILKLTKEVVELRLYKAALSSPEDKSTSSDVVTIRENTDEDVTPDGNLPLIVNQTDSGHFEDFTNPTTIQDGATAAPPKLMVDKSIMVDDTPEHQQLILEYEKRFQELIRTHEEESLQLKQKHNDKIDELLQRITEINRRYWELVPELDLAKAKIKELESQLEEAVQKLQQHEEEQQQKQKEQEEQQKKNQEETARLEKEIKVMEVARQGPSRISVPELLQQLQVTKNELDSVKDYEFASSSNNLQPLLSAKEALALWVLGARKAMYRQLMEARNKNKIDPEITLQFLKSAIYYFLTDKENSQGHLKAIQSILGFSASEISSIERARMS